MKHGSFVRVAVSLPVLAVGVLLLSGCVGNDPKVEADIRAETMKQGGGKAPSQATGKTPGKPAGTSAGP